MGKIDMINIKLEYTTSSQIFAAHCNNASKKSKNRGPRSSEYTSDSKSTLVEYGSVGEGKRQFLWSN